MAMAIHENKPAMPRKRAYEFLCCSAVNESASSENKNAMNRTKPINPVSASKRADRAGDRGRQLGVAGAGVVIRQRDHRRLERLGPRRDLGHRGAAVGPGRVAVQLDEHGPP